MKKYFVLLLIAFFSSISNVYADNYCNDTNVKQVAKILYKEVGGTLTSDANEDFFAKLVTASVIVNNAYYKNGNSFSEKLYNLTDNNYARYSTYKYSSFENVIDSNYQSKMLYIAELVLTGQFSVPKEMRLQASKSIVERYGTVWTTTSVSYASGIDVYFGYSGTLSNQDVFGNTLASTNPSYYRSLAASLANNNYTNYNTSNICQHEKVSVNGSSNNNYNNSNNSNNKNIDYKIELCSDPNILRVIYIIKTVITIIKIIIPAIIILMGIISYSRVLIIDNQNLQSVTISFIKKIFIGVLIFFIPTIVTSILSLVNFKIKSFNFNDCYKNANLIKIKDLENKTK